MSEWIWPLAMALCAVSSTVFTKYLERSLEKNPAHPQARHLQKSLERFRNREPANLMLLGAAMIWAALLAL